MNQDNNLPTGYIEENEQTEEEFEQVLSECEEFDDSDEVREQ